MFILTAFKTVGNEFKAVASDQAFLTFSISAFGLCLCVSWIVFIAYVTGITVTW
jgi:hypothetical protein